MTPPQPSYKIATLNNRPSLADEFWPQKQRIWPLFMFHDRYAATHWGYLNSTFANHQLYLLNDADEPIAVAQTIPCNWDGTLAGLPVGWSDVLRGGVDDYEAGRPPNTLSALEAAINPDYQGQGVSYQLINAVKVHAEAQGFQAVIIAVRPSQKSNYPLASMERYAKWLREDNTPFDPWLRVHWRLGGEILTVAHPSMVIDGSVDDWEAWTGMVFPESGDYVIPNALAPIHIDREMNLGRYVEPNVWVHHPITTKPLLSKD